MIKNKRSKNNGLVRFYLQNNDNSSYRDKTNVKSLKGLDYIKSQFYSIETVRQEDNEFAETVSRKLSMKIKINIDLSLTSSCKCVLNNKIFDILKIDHDYYNRESYIYLEEVAVLDPA